MYKYTCEYCGKDYIPKRRGIQRFCSDSCRSRNHQIKKKIGKTQIEHKEISSLDQNNRTPGINLPDIGNSAIGAAAGIAAYDGLKSFLTSSENKPVTKKDLETLLMKNSQRYYLIKNMSKDSYGQSPFFDTKTQNIYYSHIK